MLVHIQFPFSDQLAEVDEVAEIRALAESAGAEIMGVLSFKRDKPDARYFLGKGKLEELSEEVNETGTDLVIFNHALTPAQERNLEKALQCRVLDRAGLILDIFAQRARTHEGKLQVELAQLQHMSTRLVRGWTHLERQKGGIGLRGPGETQLETDRRLLSVRIKQLQAKLEKVRRQRSNNREARRKRDMATLALVGYTNAGKSTLFNAMTQSGAYVANQLFATLDPTIRRIELPDAKEVLLADTVGFVNNLPHELVAAFRATLEEAREAKLLLHVVDASDELREERILQVNRVLKEIGAETIPQVLVFNKADLLERSHVVVQPQLISEEAIPEIWLSAKTGEGVDKLEALLDRILANEQRMGWVEVKPGEGKLRAELHALANVLEERFTEQGVAMIHVSISTKRLFQLRQRHQLPIVLIQEAPGADSEERSETA
jgi:GTP-binding protein HflX